MKSQKVVKTTLCKMRGKLNLLKTSISTSKEAAEKTNEEISMLDVIVTALERHLRIRAIVPKNLTGGYACPRCGHHLNGMPFYCANCGQHLDYKEPDKSKDTKHQLSVSADVEVVTNKKNEELIQIRIDDADYTFNAHVFKEALMTSSVKNISGTLTYKEYVSNNEE